MRHMSQLPHNLLSFDISSLPSLTLSPLFGGEIGWIENFKEKIGKKIFWSVFDWVRRKETKWWSVGVFSPCPQFYFENGEKTKKKMFGQKTPLCQVLSTVSFFIFLVFFFPFVIFVFTHFVFILHVGCFFFINFLLQLLFLVLFLFFLIFFSFFFLVDFLFIYKFPSLAFLSFSVHFWCFYLFFSSVFFFLICYYFIYQEHKSKFIQIIFSISLLFYFQSKHHERKLKTFLSSLYLLFSHFSTIPTKPTLRFSKSDLSPISHSISICFDFITSKFIAVCFNSRNSKV